MGKLYAFLSCIYVTFFITIIYHKRICFNLFSLFFIPVMQVNLFHLIRAMSNIILQSIHLVHISFSKI